MNINLFSQSLVNKYLALKKQCDFFGILIPPLKTETQIDLIEFLIYQVFQNADCRRHALASNYHKDKQIISIDKERLSETFKKLTLVNKEVYGHHFASFNLAVKSHQNELNLKRKLAIAEKHLNHAKDSSATEPSKKTVRKRKNKTKIKSNGLVLAAVSDSKDESGLSAGCGSRFSTGSCGFLGWLSSRSQ